MNVTHLHATENNNKKINNSYHVAKPCKSIFISKTCETKSCRSNCLAVIKKSCSEKLHENYGKQWRKISTEIADLDLQHKHSIAGALFQILRNFPKLLFYGTFADICILALIILFSVRRHRESKTPNRICFCHSLFHIFLSRYWPRKFLTISSAAMENTFFLLLQL